MTFSVKVLNSSKCFDGPVFDVVQETILLPSGKEAKHLTVTHPGAIVVIPEISSGRVLLVNQYRHSVRKNLLEFPAGTLDEGEEPLTCAKREIQEEVGFAASEWISLGTQIPTPGFCSEIQHCYLARGLTPSKLVADDDELIEVVEMGVEEVFEEVRKGSIVDCKTIAIFMKAYGLRIER